MTTNQTIDGVPREQMISFPRELSDELAELIAEKARVCGGGAFEIWEAICDQFGTQAKHHGEPVAYAAFADNGNIRCWSSNCEAVGLKVLAEGGSEIVPLYRHPAEQIAADALKAFANEMINASFEGGSFDGGDIQDIAAKHGLLRIESRNEECGEVCACREYGFPAECYRKTDLIANTPQ